MMHGLAESGYVVDEFCNGKESGYAWLACTNRMLCCVWYIGANGTWVS